MKFVSSLVHCVAKERGVSEIVSQILMILLVMSIGTVILTYSMGYFSGLSGASDLMTKMNSDTLKERFIIVNVNASGANDVWVSVYNYGQQNVTIDGMYVLGESVNIARTTIMPGEFETIYGDYPGVFTGVPFAIRVVSTLGNYYENIYTQ
jgi:archaellum component FlaF (FlaF/FlaG flagellin family)